MCVFYSSVWEEESARTYADIWAASGSTWGRRSRGWSRSAGCSPTGWSPCCRCTGWSSPRWTEDPTAPACCSPPSPGLRRKPLRGTDSKRRLVIVSGGLSAQLTWPALVSDSHEAEIQARRENLLKNTQYGAFVVRNTKKNQPRAGFSSFRCTNVFFWTNWRNKCDILCYILLVF